IVSNESTGLYGAIVLLLKCRMTSSCIVAGIGTFCINYIKSIKVFDTYTGHQSFDQHDLGFIHISCADKNNVCFDGGILLFFSHLNKIMQKYKESANKKIHLSLNKWFPLFKYASMTDLPADV